MIEWENPPPATRGRNAPDENSDHAKFAAQLRTRPGAWGVVKKIQNPTPQQRTRAYALATAIRSGRLTSYAKGAFEAKARFLADDKGKTTMKVYARYVR